MKSFREYTEQSETQEETTMDAQMLTQKIASAYNGKSNADILRKILTEAEKSKRAGTLSNEEIESFYQAFAPMVDNAQRKKLRAIVDKLKQI